MRGINVDYKQLVIKVDTDTWVRKLICGGKTLSTIKAKGTNIKVKSSGVFLQISQLYIIPQVPKSFSPLHSKAIWEEEENLSYSGATFPPPNFSS